MPHGTSGGAPFWSGSVPGNTDHQIERLEKKKEEGNLSLKEYDDLIEAKMEKNREDFRRNHPNFGR